MKFAPRPPDPELPLEMRFLKMTHQLAFHTGTYSADRNRTRRLVTFASRPARKVNGMPRDPSKVQYNDRPEIELYLWHRDESMFLATAILRYREKLDKVVATDEHALEAMAKALQSLDRLEEKRLKHVAAMEKILEVLGKEQANRETVMANLAKEAAKLAQAAAQHKDRMDLAREGSTVEDADTIRMRLATKYNITPEQVDQMLSAKDVSGQDMSADAR